MHDFVSLCALGGHSSFFERAHGQITAKDGLVKFHGLFGVAIEPNVGIELRLHRCIRLSEYVLILPERAGFEKTPPSSFARLCKMGMIV